MPGTARMGVVTVGANLVAVRVAFCRCDELVQPYRRLVAGDGERLRRGRCQDRQAHRWRVFRRYEARCRRRERLRRRNRWLVLGDDQRSRGRGDELRPCCTTAGVVQREDLRRREHAVVQRYLVKRAVPVVGSCSADAGGAACGVDDRHAIDRHVLGAEERPVDVELDRLGAVVVGDDDEVRRGRRGRPRIAVGVAEAGGVLVQVAPRTNGDVVVELGIGCASTTEPAHDGVARGRGDGGEAHPALCAEAGR